MILSYISYFVNIFIYIFTYFSYFYYYKLHTIQKTKRKGKISKNYLPFPFIINHYNLQYNFRIYSIYSKRTFIVPPHAIPNFAATVLDKS